MMTGIGVTIEALSLFLHLSENKYGTAWSGGMKVGLSKRTRGEEGWMGWAVWILLHEGDFCLLCTTGVKKKNQENYESNRHSSGSSTGDLPPYFLMNLCVFPTGGSQLLPSQVVRSCLCC